MKDNTLTLEIAKKLQLKEENFADGFALILDDINRYAVLRKTLGELGYVTNTFLPISESTPAVLSTNESFSAIPNTEYIGIKDSAEKEKKYQYQLGGLRVTSDGLATFITTAPREMEFGLYFGITGTDALPKRTVADLIDVEFVTNPLNAKTKNFINLTKFLDTDTIQLIDTLPENAQGAVIDKLKKSFVDQLLTTVFIKTIGKTDSEVEKTIRVLMNQENTITSPFIYDTSTISAYYDLTAIVNSYLKKDTTDAKLAEYCAMLAENMFASVPQSMTNSTRLWQTSINGILLTEEMLSKTLFTKIKRAQIASLGLVVTDHGILTFDESPTLCLKNDAKFYVEVN